MMSTEISKTAADEVLSWLFAGLDLNISHVMARDSEELFWSDRTVGNGSDQWRGAKIFDRRSEDIFSCLKDNDLSASYQEI